MICSGDDLSGEKSFKTLTHHLRNKKEEATVAKRLIDLLPTQGTVNRGVFIVDENQNVIDGEEIKGISLENFREKSLEEDTLVSLSIFALHPRTLNFLNDRLKKFKDENRENREIEFYLNIELTKLIKENKIGMKIYTTEEKWLGITNKEDEEKVRKSLKKIIK